MFDFRRITLFRLEKRLSKHKMTMFSKNFWGAMAPLSPLATPMDMSELRSCAVSGASRSRLCPDGPRGHDFALMGLAFSYSARPTCLVVYVHK